MLLIGRDTVINLVQSHRLFYLVFVRSLQVKVQNCLHIVTFTLSIVM